MVLEKALIAGITGQDGSYLAEFLLAKGDEVPGGVRRVALQDPAHRMSRIMDLPDKIQLHRAAVESQPSLFQVYAECQPDECCHLAAHSFVSYSFDDEFSTAQSNIRTISAGGSDWVLIGSKTGGFEGRIFVVQRGKRYWAPSVEWVKSAGFRWPDDIVWLGDDEIAIHPLALGLPQETSG